MSLLGRLFRRDRTQPSATPSTQCVLMVMLADDSPVSPDAIFDDFSTRWPDAPALRDRQTQEGASAATIPGGAVGLVHIPQPIPGGDLEGPVAVSWHWPESEAVVGAHRAHVIVHAGSTELDAVDVRLIATRLAASVLHVTNGVGVYVGEAMLVRSADDYRDDAAHATRGELPILSWVGFNLVNEDDAFSAYTTGLSAFGLPELEVRRSSMAPQELLGTIADLAHYQLASGKALRDGDTFGASETDRTRVRFQRSAFIPDMTVATLELP